MKPEPTLWILKSPEGIPVGEFSSYHDALVTGYSKYGLEPFKVIQEPPQVVTIATPFFSEESASPHGNWTAIENSTTETP